MAAVPRPHPAVSVPAPDIARRGRPRRSHAEPAGQCPLLRSELRSDGSRRRSDHYIGRLTLKEFDWIDLFMISGRGMMLVEIADRIGISRDTCKRYYRTMQSAGVMGVVGYQITSSIKLLPAKPSRWGTEDECKSNTTVCEYIVGPTMKAVMLWHEALGEEWDWRDYHGQPWIAAEGVLPAGAAPAA